MTSPPSAGLFVLEVLWHTGAASKEVERKNSKSKRESRTPKDSGFFATRFPYPPFLAD